MKRYFLRSFFALFAAILLSVVVVTHIAFMSVMRQMETRPSNTMKLVSMLMAERFAEMTVPEVKEWISTRAATLDSPIYLADGTDPSIDPGVVSDLGHSGMSIRRVWRGTGYSLMVYVPVRVEGRDFIMVAGPVDRQYGPDMYAFVMMGAFILVIMFLSSMVFAFPMWRRLRILEKTARAVADGHLEARIPIPAEDGMVGFLASQFNTMVSRIDELLASQKMMLQAVSHELRTPSARIRFGLEMLESAKDPVERARRLDAIDEDLAELDELVEELLIFNKTEALKQEIERSPVNVSDVLGKLIEKRAFLRPGVDVVLDVSDNSMELMVDQRAFIRAIGNLLSNAMRFTRTQVRIVVRRDGSLVMVEVADDGPGVPEQSRSTILQPFKRLDGSRNRESGGAGLGLAIVSSIVNAHRGRIEILDADIGGAAFCTWWPLSED